MIRHSSFIFDLVAIVAAAAVISMYSIQKIIFITRHRKLYDVPDDTRKIHGAEIPSLGGIGIFIGYIIVAVFFWPPVMRYMLCSSVILFFTGIYDDIMNMKPSKKLLAQLIASFITVSFAHVEIWSLHGLFGIGELNTWPGILLTTILCTFFINVFNFVDGIDGLASALAILYTAVLGYFFAANYFSAMACVLFALMGATIGLLFYNKSPAKIYMGDTGSMFIGFSIFIFSLLFLQYRESNLFQDPKSALMFIIAMLFLPVYDAIRVFILRASKGISPLKADRTHLHYYLLDAGFTHSQSVLIILMVNILIMLCAYLLQDVNPNINLLCMTLLSSTALFIIYKLRQKRLAKKEAMPG